MSDNEDRFLHLEISGEDNDNWQRLRPKLIRSLEAALNTVIDPSRGTTVREEAGEFSSAILEHARQRLARPGVENEKLEAEIAVLFAERERLLAEARRTRAAAEGAELQNAIGRLRMHLLFTKAVLVGEVDKEALLLGQQVKGFLEAIERMNESDVGE